MKRIFLFCIFYFINCNDFFLKREYSLTKPYSGSWNFIGVSVITNDYVRLTANQQSQYGGISNLYPNVMRNWEIHLNLKVHGNHGILFGDGLAFWYTSNPIKPGPIFGNENYFKGLAIFLDTYSNYNGPHHHDHPYISAMINNGTLSYDHDTDGTHTQLAGCSAQFRNKAHDTIVAIRFVNNKLTVSHDIDNENKWRECFSVDNVKLPLGYYFSLTAATGQLSDNHDIISIKSYEVEGDHTSDSDIDLYKVEPFAELKSSPRVLTEDDTPSVIWKILKVLFYIVLIVGFGVGVAMSYFLYQKNEQQKKRLY